MSAVVNIVPFILVDATSYTRSICQLYFDLSIIIFKYLASNKIFIDSPFRKMITGFVKLFPVDNCSLFTGAIISCFLRKSSSFCIRSQSFIGTLMIHIFLNIQSFFIGRFKLTFVFPASSLVVAYTFLYFKMISTTFSNCVCVR